jgi:ribosomal protein L12E/L44/L45/RPP1/RPP2
MNVLKDPDFLFTLLAAVMKRQGGELEIFEDDLLAVDMTEAVSLYYDPVEGKIILKFIAGDQLSDALARSSASNAAAPPRGLSLVPELEDDEEE